ncbi:hypothetical protein PMAYCL1PPCAC_03836, partial [Pristionchus mayeri]
DSDRLPYILSFAEDTRSRDRTHAFVRREASNQDGFNHYALKSLSRATFVDAHDITDHRPFASINDVTSFYDERRNFAEVRDRELAFGPDEVRVSTDESYEYDPDFYDAIAAQTFAERSATVPRAPSTTPRPTTTVPPTTTVHYLPAMTYASVPLQALFERRFRPQQPPPAFAAPAQFRTFTTTPLPPTVIPTTTPSTTMTTRAPTTVTISSPTTTPPRVTSHADELRKIDGPNSVVIDSMSFSEITPVLLLKSSAHHGVGSKKTEPFFRSEILNSPRRFCRHVIFVLDNSGSVKFNFERLKLIIGNLADLVFEDSARKVGMITFSSRHRQRVVYDWSLHRAAEAPKEFHRKLRDLTFAGGITQLGAALSMLQDRLFDDNIRKAFRPVDIVLFTDGYSFDDPSAFARSLRLDGHRIYIAALFTSYLRTELDSITGDPSRVFTEMEGLDSLAHSLHSCL